MRIRESDGNSDRKIGCTRSGALQADCKRSGSISCLRSEHNTMAREACQPGLEKRQRSPFPEDSFP
ncbi:hypothetical protein VE23_03000 [Paenibacillus sp. D9]|nr:hypothetical protein VE23_03000 [Paenibacillus sp. D9]